MSQRLEDLQRQRRLMQEHLAWLEQEIARELAQSPGGAPSATLPAPSPAGGSRPTVAISSVSRAPFVSEPASAAVAADQILAQYQQDPSDVRTDIRRGCIIAFSVALALFFAVVAIAYVVYPREIPAVEVLPSLER